MNEQVVLKCIVSEAQADSVRDRIAKAGLHAAYQEEQHGASLILVMKCSPLEALTIQEILAGAGIIPSDEPPLSD
jgi:hypothetical protein